MKKEDFYFYSAFLKRNFREKKVLSICVSEVKRQVREVQSIYWKFRNNEFVEFFLFHFRLVYSIKLKNLTCTTKRKAEDFLRFEKKNALCLSPGDGMCLTLRKICPTFSKLLQNFENNFFFVQNKNVGEIFLSGSNHPHELTLHLHFTFIFIIYIYTLVAIQ